MVTLPEQSVAGISSRSASFRGSGWVTHSSAISASQVVADRAGRSMISHWAMPYSLSFARMNSVSKYPSMYSPGSRFRFTPVRLISFWRAVSPEASSMTARRRLGGTIVSGPAVRICRADISVREMAATAAKARALFMTVSLGFRIVSLFFGLGVMVNF